MSTEKTMRLPASAVFRAIDETEACLLDTHTKRFFSVNPTALCILEALERGCTREEALRALSARFDTTRDRCAEDLDRFLSELREAGLLDEEGGRK